MKDTVMNTDTAPGQPAPGHQAPGTAQPTTMVGRLPLDEFERQVVTFHGCLSPGLLLGAFMVDLLLERLPPGGLYDYICESSKCLPDAVQLLTPCSIGNGWLQILDVGRFAIIGYDKHSGVGLRVTIDFQHLESWSEIKNWFLQLTSKKQQDSELLLRQIRSAGKSLLALRPVTVALADLHRPTWDAVAVCKKCGEAFPQEHGQECLVCQGKALSFVSLGS